jgi:hypothetical protein
MSTNFGMERAMSSRPGSASMIDVAGSNHSQSNMRALRATTPASGLLLRCKTSQRGEARAMCDKDPAAVREATQPWPAQTSPYKLHPMRGTPAICFKQTRMQTLPPPPSPEAPPRSNERAPALVSTHSTHQLGRIQPSRAQRGTTCDCSSLLLG